MGFDSIPLVDLSFDSLRLSRAGRRLLDDVSGRFRHGELSVVLGPSGAGKTTLLQVLAGKLVADSGAVRLNGQPGAPSRLRSFMGFVPEEDVMLRTLTVEETLSFAARLRLPGATPAAKAARAAEVEQALRLLGLRPVRATRVGDAGQGGVSFGERRRLNIGIELVGRPSVVLVDDATAGLDSETALQVLSCLRLVSRRGINVVAILHQPSADAFALFSSVLLLAPLGRVAFEGRTAAALRHFEEAFGLRCPRYTNPAEFLLELVSDPPPSAPPPGSKPDDADDAAAAGAARARDGRRWRGHAGAAEEAEALLGERPRGGLGGEFGARVERFLERTSPTRRVDGGRKRHGADEIGLSDDDEALLGRASRTEPAHLARAWRRLAPAPSSGEFGAAEALGLPIPRSAARISFGAMLLLFSRRALLQWRRAWLKSMTEVLLAGLAAFLVALTHLEAGYIGPVPAQHRRECATIVHSLEHDPRYAAYAGPAIEMCDRNLKDGIPLAVEQLGEALSFVAMAVAMRVFGPDMQVFVREVRSLRGAVAYLLAKELAHAPFQLLAPLLSTAAATSVLRLRLHLQTVLLALTLLVWCACGVGYVVSIALDKVRASVAGSVVLMLWIMSNGMSPRRQEWSAWGLGILPRLSPQSWYLELLYVSTVRQYAAEWDVANGIANFGFREGDYWLAVRSMLAIGVGLRVLACLMLAVVAGARPFSPDAPDEPQRARRGYLQRAPRALPP